MDRRAAVAALGAADWDPVREAGLVCSMGYPTARNDFIATGFNDRANHRMLLRELEETIPLAARHGVPNVIAMFGNRRGKTDAEAIDTCVAGLNQIKAQAEAERVTICLELLNSKVDHADYQDWIAHFHTGGVPGRHELDGTQELNWRAVASAIADTGFAGFVAHEFVPTRDPLTSLREAVAVCNV